MVCNWNITYFSADKFKRSSWIIASDAHGRIRYFLFPRILAISGQGEERSVEGKSKRGNDLQGLTPQKSLLRNPLVAAQFPWEETRQVANRKKREGGCLDPRILTSGDFLSKAECRTICLYLYTMDSTKNTNSTQFMESDTQEPVPGFISQLKSFSKFLDWTKEREVLFCFVL